MQGLGIESYIGSSGRVFPVEMKAAPLLRAWLKRLLADGVKFHYRHRCVDLSTINHDRIRLSNSVQLMMRLFWPVVQCHGHN